MKVLQLFLICFVITSCNNNNYKLVVGKYKATTPTISDVIKFKFLYQTTCKVWGDSNEVIVINNDNTLTKLKKDSLIISFPFYMKENTIISGDSNKITYVLGENSIYHIINFNKTCNGKSLNNYKCLKKYVLIDK